MMPDEWDFLVFIFCGLMLVLTVGALLTHYLDHHGPFENQKRNSAGRRAMARDVWK